MSAPLVWQTEYYSEWKRIETDLSNLTIEEEAEWIACQAAWCAAGRQKEETYRRVTERLKKMRDSLSEEEDGATQPALRVARALCAWGLAAKEGLFYGAGAALVELLYERAEALRKKRIAIEWWVQALRLCGAAAHGESATHAHLLASHCVAVLINDFYQTETDSFLQETVPGVWEEKQGSVAELFTALEVTDGLAAEAIRCGDDRLFDWSIRRAQALMQCAGMDSVAVELMRRIGMRAEFYRGDTWGRKWLEQHGSERDGPAVIRLESLAVMLESLRKSQL